MLKMMMSRVEEQEDINEHGQGSYEDLHIFPQTCSNELEKHIKLDLTVWSYLYYGVYYTMCLVWKKRRLTSYPSYQSQWPQKI